MQIQSQPLRTTGNVHSSWIFGGGGGDDEVGVAPGSPPLLQRPPNSRPIFSPPHSHRLPPFYSQYMEQEGTIMESLDYDEHGIPTVFFLNVDNLDVEGQEDNNGEDPIMGLSDNNVGGGVHNGDVRLVASSEEEQPFTHHYSLQEDGTIQYHHQSSSTTITTTATATAGGNNGIGAYHDSDNNTIHLGDGSDQNFEFEEITTMPHTTTSGGLNLNHFQLRLQSNSSTSSSTTSALTFPFTVTTTNNNVLTATTATTPPISSPTSSTSTGATITNGGFLLRQQQQQQQQQTSSVQLQFHAQSGQQVVNSSAPQKRKLTSSTISSLNPQIVAESLQKRPKLLVNLYEAEVGYEFGALLRDSSPPSQLSHLIPYSEDYLLRALDREEIPTKVLAHLSPVLRWRRGHLLAQIRDYRRFSSATQVVPTKPTGGGGKGRGSGGGNSGTNTFNNNNNQLQYRVLKRSNPVVTELILRPTTASKLADFESILSRATKVGRSNWKRARIASTLASSSTNLMPLTNTNTKGGTNAKASNRSRPISSEDNDAAAEWDDEVLDDSDYELELEEGNNNGREDRGRLTYEQRLELEKDFINKTAGPLCLDPSPRVALIQNRIQFERLKWRCPSLLPKRVPSPPPTKQEEAAELSSFVSSSCLSAPAKAASFTAFITRIKERNKEKDRERGTPSSKEDPLKLLELLPFVEYPLLELPSCMDEILRLGPTPEPTTLRPLPIDNFIKKIEEYTLETERRKRPHTTKLSIFQRNGMDAYFGELEMESIQEGGITSSSNKPGGGGGGQLSNLGVGGGAHLVSTSTKCQFELGSSQSVALYVKQFSDIFTEDGRRPCKITYQKVGQPVPQVLYTNSYKTAGAAAAATTPGTCSTPATPTTPTNNSAAAVLTSTPPTNPPQQQQQSQPPVQIVHPQPRSAQPQPNTNDQQAQQQLIPGSVPQSQQILTRPQQQQQQQVMTASQLVQAQKPAQQQQQQHNQTPQPPPLGPTNVPTASASHQQLLQQRLLRLKQVQAQQAAAQAQSQSQTQPHQTALAKLLLTNMNTSSTAATPTTPSSRPITVAVQPQPQKAVASSSLTSSSDGQQQQNHVSVNLNTMVLDGLLSQNQAAQLRAHGQIQLQQQQQNQGLVGHQQAVNILRGGNHQVVVSSGGTILGGNRYTTSSNTGSGGGFTSIQSQGLGHQIHHHSGGGQRILINANNGQQLTLSSSSPHHGGGGGSSSNDILEELSVPDLNSLLANVSSSSSNQHQLHHHIESPTTQLQQHNLNLNLNLNLNSGGASCGLGLDSVNLNNLSSHHNQSTPPFLVFISPLRSVPVSINANNNVNVGNSRPSLLQQQLNAGPQQSIQSQQQQQQQQLSLSLDGSGGSVVTSSSSNDPGGSCGLEGGEYYTMSDGTGSTEIKLEPVDHGQSSSHHHHPSSSSSTVMIGNTAYSLNVSSSSGGGYSSASSGGGGGNSGGDSKKDVITLSSLLGSSNKPNISSSGPGNLPPLILHPQQHPQQQQNPGGIVVSSPSSVLSSTPRLSALLAGTPSADSAGSGGGSGSIGLSGLISPGGIRGNDASSRTLLDRLAASLSTSNTTSLSSPSSSGISSTGGGGSSPPVMIRSGLNPIASATPNVVLDHPVLAATLTGQGQGQGLQGAGATAGAGQSPKLVSAYRQIAPAPIASSPSPNSSRGKQP